MQVACSGWSPTVALMTALVAATAASAQQPAIRVGPNVRLGGEPDGRVLVEPHLAAHPSDPDHLLAVGWVVGREGNDPAVEHCATFLSRDGGRRWTRSDLSGHGCGDPWVSITAQGRAVLTLLGGHAQLPDSIGNYVAVRFSPDGGATWSALPQVLGRFVDGPRNLAAPDGAVFITAGQGWPVGTTTRFGVLLGRTQPTRSFVDIMTRLAPSNLNLVSDGMAILPDSSLLVTWTDFQRPVRSFRSREGVLRTRRTWAARSTDGGATFGLPMLVTDACYARPTFLAIDASHGAHRGRLYHVCDGDEERSVLFMSSADGGQEWEEARPIEPPSGTAHARTSAGLAVNRDGVLAIAWMDRRGDASGRCYAPYITVSRDGGQTFAPPVRVAEEPSCPDATRIGGPARRWPEGGDYFGLAAAADGRFHLVWPDARDGVFALWSASVTVSSGSR